MTSSELLNANIENAAFSEDSMPSPTPASTSHKDKQSVFRDISNECSPNKPSSRDKLRKKSKKLIKSKIDEHQTHSLADIRSRANISLVEMAVRVLEKNRAYASQSSPVKYAMHINDILDELAIEFPFFNEQPRSVWRFKFQGALRTAYFHRTKDDKGKSFWSLNKERYSHRLYHKRILKTPPMMRSKFAVKSTPNRGSIRNAEAENTTQELMKNVVERITVAELIISVFLKITSPQGYSANEVLQGIKILFPTRNTSGLYSAIEDELSRNTLYYEVPSICLIKLYKLKATNLEKLTSEHHHVLEKCQKNSRKLVTIGGNLHGFCKRWSQTDDEGIPEKYRSETELTKLHILTGVLLISPPGMEYTMRDIIERAALLYPNHSVPNPTLDFSRQIYVTSEIQRHSYNAKTLRYYMDPEVYPKYEARRIFLQNRLPILNLTEKKVNYLLTVKKYIISSSEESKPSPAASRILADMGLGKRYHLPSFRKQKVNEVKQSQIPEKASNDRSEHAGSETEGQHAHEESKQEGKQESN